jgi:hypothetical protein
MNLAIIQAFFNDPSFHCEWTNYWMQWETSKVLTALHSLT